ncbi:hypothetical protein PT974_11238 [Cladobotryum mycophilum]|uniref:DUF4536 domain-containing protein n=1 Tax=Cladobotryum mycophilum TaxID=491253 RepID=A0ABR0S5R6_9HYPO
MAGDKIPTLQSLEKPEKLQDVLRQDRGDDCLSCRVVGKFVQVQRSSRVKNGAFFGLAGYSYFSGMSQLERQRHVILQSKSMFGMRSRKFGIFTISAGLAWMGLWRAFR